MSWRQRMLRMPHLCLLGSENITPCLTAFGSQNQGNWVKLVCHRRIWSFSLFIETCRIKLSKSLDTFYDVPHLNYTVKSRLLKLEVKHLCSDYRLLFPSCISHSSQSTYWLFSYHIPLLMLSPVSSVLSALSVVPCLDASWGSRSTQYLQ